MLFQILSILQFADDLVRLFLARWTYEFVTFVEHCTINLLNKIFGKTKEMIVHCPLENDVLQGRIK